MTLTEMVLQDVALERARQDSKWGVQNHNIYKWLAILGEEVGEANQAALDGDYDNFHQEIIQIAAVATAIVEANLAGRVRFNEI